MGRASVSPAVFLAQLLALDGVLDAALIGPAGQPLEPLLAAQPFAPVQEVLKAYLTSDRVLAELLGAETPAQTVVAFDAETVLLTLSTRLGGEPCRVVTLCAVHALSGVRAELEQLASEAAKLTTLG